MKLATVLLLLTFYCRTQQAFNNDFHKSSFKLELSSNGQTKNIPQLYDCSCELIVFPISNFTFTATLSLIDKSYTHAKIKFKQSNICRILAFDSKYQASIDISNSVYSKQDEITEDIKVELIRSKTAPHEDNCEGIQNRGQTRMVYIIRTVQNKYKYDIKLPMNAEWLTQLIAIMALLVLPQNIKYRRFVPFQFGFISTVLYSCFLFAAVYIQLMYSSDLNLQITFWSIMVFSFACMVLYLADLLSIILEKVWLIWSLSSVCSLIVVAVDAFVLPDAWFVNDIIALLVVGALIKFVVIKKLKAAVIPIVFLWFLFIFRQFFVTFRLQNFEQALQINIIPLFIQFPAIISDDQKGYICSAFGTSKIITMGLILNYCVRIDLFLSSHFYTIISTIIACICLIFQLGITYLADDLPVMEYSSCIIFIPLTLICILLLSSKRGEWAEVWHGSFHDIAVDRKSIKKQQYQLNQEEMYRNFEFLQVNRTTLLTE